MSGLGAATVAMIWAYGVVSAAAVVAQVSVIVIGWPRRKARRPLARRAGRALARLWRDIVRGVANVTEGVLYGRW